MTFETQKNNDLNIKKEINHKSKKIQLSGVCKILATFNNTKICFTDLNGNVISWSSAGKCKFKGSRKSTAYAAQVATSDAAKIAISKGFKEVEVHIEGPGVGRDSSVRALQASGLNITKLIDTTPVPHNGCRQKKPRSV